MSLETWKAEFYPVEAKECPRALAVEHSLQKWRGVTKENLVRHGCERVPWSASLGDGSARFIFGASSCALCVAHPSCNECPLVSVLGESCDEDAHSPWSAWVESSNPLPMIKALEAALKLEKEKHEPC